MTVARRKGGCWFGDPESAGITLDFIESISLEGANKVTLSLMRVNLLKQ